MLLCFVHLFLCLSDKKIVSETLNLTHTHTRVNFSTFFFNISFSFWGHLRKHLGLRDTSTFSFQKMGLD